MYNQLNINVLTRSKIIYIVNSFPRTLKKNANSYRVENDSMMHDIQIYF